MRKFIKGELNLIQIIKILLGLGILGFMYYRSEQALDLLRIIAEK